MSTITRDLVNALRTVDPDDVVINIDGAVLEKEGQISEGETRAAEARGVRLVGAKEPRGSKKPLSLEWLNELSASYYRHVVARKDYDVIIGHAPHVASGTLNLRDVCVERGCHPRVILMVHSLPKNQDDEVDEDSLLDWLSEADSVFSIGQGVWDEVSSYIGALEPHQVPEHRMYLPGFPVELFSVTPEVKDNKAVGTQTVAMMTEEGCDPGSTSLDFALAVNATLHVAQSLRQREGLRVNLSLVTDKPHTEQWKKHFTDVLTDQNSNAQTGLKFQCFTPETLEKLRTHFKRSNLFLLPLKSDSPLFGQEALSAAAAGTPVLVSRFCGVAVWLKSLGDAASVVWGSDADVWASRVAQTLLAPAEATRRAEELRKQLLLNSQIAASHLDCVKTVTGRSGVGQPQKYDVKPDAKRLPVPSF